MLTLTPNVYVYKSYLEPLAVSVWRVSFTSLLRVRRLMWVLFFFLLVDDVNMRVKGFLDVGSKVDVGSEVWGFESFGLRAPKS